MIRGFIFGLWWVARFSDRVDKENSAFLTAKGFGTMIGDPISFYLPRKPQTGA